MPCVALQGGEGEGQQSQARRGRAAVRAALRLALTLRCVLQARLLAMSSRRSRRRPLAVNCDHAAAHCLRSLRAVDRSRQARYEARHAQEEASWTRARRWCVFRLHLFSVQADLQVRRPAERNRSRITSACTCISVQLTSLCLQTRVPARCNRSVDSVLSNYRIAQLLRVFAALAATAAWPPPRAHEHSPRARAGQACTRSSRRQQLALLCIR